MSLWFVFLLSTKLIKNAELKNQNNNLIQRRKILNKCGITYSVFSISSCIDILYLSISFVTSFEEKLWKDKSGK